MKKKAESCASVITKSSETIVVSHIDADGLTSAAIMCSALERAGIDCKVRFLKQLNTTALEEISNDGHELVIFTDLGSGMLSSISALGMNAVVIDHHQPAGTFENHINPHLFGINGAYEASGSCMAYMVAQALGDNRDLADIAIVGAVGDLQHLKHGRLTGANKDVLEQGVSGGVLHYGKDLLLFGRQTRPVFKLLQYATDPYLPGLTGSEDACIDFLRKVGIHLHGERWRRWIDMELPEKQRVVSALFSHCIGTGMPAQKIQRLVGEAYTLLREREGTELRDASEYATLLNATARYDFSDTGLAVCMGDRDAAFKQACNLLNDHRKNLVEGLNLVREKGVTRLANLQYFDAGSRIRETIVGIVAGMYSSISMNRDLPIIAFADADGGAKVSARGTHDLVVCGLNLGAAISEAAKAVGGTGGGHDIAAGGFIPYSRKEEFLSRLDSAIGSQLGHHSSSM